MLNWNTVLNIKESFKEKDDKVEDTVKEKKKCINCGKTNLSRYNNEKIVCQDCGQLMVIY